MLLLDTAWLHGAAALNRTAIAHLLLQRATLALETGSCCLSLAQLSSQPVALLWISFCLSRLSLPGATS